MNVAILLSVHDFEQHFVEKLGLTHDEFAERWRGGWVWSYCRMLAGEGITPHVYVASLERDDKVVTPEGWVVRFVPAGAIHRVWRRAPVLRRTRYGRYASGVASALSIRRALRAGIREDGIDVLLMQEYWGARLDVLVGRLGVPVVAVDQGLVADKLVTAFKRFTLKRAAHLVTMTEFEADRVRALGGRAERIPNGVDTDFWAPNGQAVEDRLVVTVAQLNEPHKRLSDLIRAVDKLGDGWRAEIAGRGHDRETYERLIEELGVGDRVSLIGYFTDRESLRAFVRRGAIFCLPSAWEGLPLALLEAMSTGAAAVCSDIPAMAEVVTDGHDGITVPVGDPDRLAEAIAAAAERRDALGEAGRSTVLEQYSERAVGARLAETLRNAR